MREVQNAGGQLAVPSSSAGFLVVALDGLGKHVVHDEAHVGLVDAHPEGYGRGDHLLLVADPRRLRLGALLVREAGVVADALDAAGRQLRRHVVALLPREAVHDPRVAAVFGLD